MAWKRIRRGIASILVGGMCLGVSCTDLKQQACDCPEPTELQDIVGGLEDFYNDLVDNDED